MHRTSTNRRWETPYNVRFTADGLRDRQKPMNSLACFRR
ncbi:hypothetical protein SXCC_00709 [Gluconacetobacter sp. SXCC-1]|nr:hypothetical protein SXCC_00709 [Gluconacetobacter sp. SXCC-1]